MPNQLKPLALDHPDVHQRSQAPILRSSQAFIRALKRKKKFAKATHNTWGLVTSNGPVKNDDGEAGAGMVILRMLEREGVQDEIVVVTRWFGGKHLGGDRFRHVQDAVRIYLERRVPPDA